MKILFNEWFKQRVNVNLVVYTKWMLNVYTNYSEVRKCGQLWWKKGQRFELVIRIGRIQFTYTDYSIGGEANEQAAEEEPAEETEWKVTVGKA